MTVSAASALNVTGTDTDARDYTTASWTPVAGEVYLAAIAVLDLGSARDIGNATLSGNNITWTPVSAGVGGTAAQPALRVWRGKADLSATAGALTWSGVVTSGNTADGAVWGVVALSGVDPETNDGIVQAAVASSSTDAVTATLGAFSSANNATGAWIVSYDNASTTGPAITAGSGFAIVTGLNAGQAAGGDGMRLAFEFKNSNDTGADATAVAANDRMLAVAVEIAAGEWVLPTGPTASVTAGTGSVKHAFAPTGPTASVTPGMPSFGVEVDPVGPTASVTPGTPKVSPGVSATGSTATVTPGTPGLDVGVAPTGPTVAITPGAGSVGPGLSPVGPTAAVTPGALAVNRHPTPTGPTVAVTPGGASLLPIQELAVTGPAVAITPGSPRLDVAVTPTGPTVAITPGPLDVAAPDVLVAAPTATASAGALTLSVGVAVGGPTVDVSAGIPVVADENDLDEDGLPRWRRMPPQ